MIQRSFINLLKNIFFFNCPDLTVLIAAVSPSHKQLPCVLSYQHTHLQVYPGSNLGLDLIMESICRFFPWDPWLLKYLIHIYWKGHYQWSFKNLCLQSDCGDSGITKTTESYNRGTLSVVESKEKYRNKKCSVEVLVNREEELPQRSMGTLLSLIFKTLNGDDFQQSLELKCL